MTKKQKAAVVAAILSVAGAFGLGVNGQMAVGDIAARVTALEVRVEEREKALDRRLDRLEEHLRYIRDRIDRVQDRGR